jgi:hypothetical protein
VRPARNISICAPVTPGHGIPQSYLGLGDGILLGFFNWPFHLQVHLMVDDLRTGLRSR